MTARGQLGESPYRFSFAYREERAMPRRRSAASTFPSRKYTAGGRRTAPNGGLIADRRNSGGYVLLGYRTPWWTIMPYGKAEYTADSQMQAIGIYQKMMLLTGGLNVRPRPNVVLKAEYVYAFFPEGKPLTFETWDIKGVDLQIAWSF